MVFPAPGGREVKGGGFKSLTILLFSFTPKGIITLNGGKRILDSRCLLRRIRHAPEFLPDTWE